MITVYKNFFGFEPASFAGVSAFAGGTNSVILANHGRTGRRANRVFRTVASAAVTGGEDAFTASVVPNGEVQKLRLIGHIKLQAYPSVSDLRVLGWSGQRATRMELSTTGQYRVYSDWITGSPSAYSSFTLSLQRWYRIVVYSMFSRVGATDDTEATVEIRDADSDALLDTIITTTNFGGELAVSLNTDRICWGNAPAGGPNATYDLLFDDFLAEFQYSENSGERASILSDFPTARRVFPVLITGQGTTNEWTNNYGSVSEIPVEAGGNSQTEATLDQSTTFVHDPANVIGVTGIQGFKAYANAIAGSAGSHAILIGATEHTAALTTTTSDDDDNNTPYGIDFTSLPDDQFNALQFGFRNKVGGVTVTLHNMVGEVLGSASTPAADDPDLVEFVGGLYLQNQIPFGYLTGDWENEQINAAGEMTCMIFQAVKAGSLDVVGFKIVTATTPQDLKVSFQNLDANGVPDGVVDQFRLVPSAQVTTGAWITTGAITSDGTDTGTRRTVARGDWIAIVIEFDSAVGNVTIGAGIIDAVALNRVGGPLHGLRTGAGVWSLEFGACFAVRYAGETSYALIPRVFPFSTEDANLQWTSTDSPDEYALRFRIPFRCRLGWVRVNGQTSTTDGQLVLYDANDNVIERITTREDLQVLGTAHNDWPFLTRPIIEANQTYRLGIPGKSNGNTVLVRRSVASAEVMAAMPPGGAEWYLSQRTDNGAWTDVLTTKPDITFVLSHLDSTAANQPEFPGGLEPQRTRMTVPIDFGGGTSLLFTIDAAGEKILYTFWAPEDGTLDLVAFRVHAAPNAQDLKVSFQDIDPVTSEPDGVIDQFRVVPAASLGTAVWIETGLMTSDGTDAGVKRTVKRGDLVCVVIEFNSVVGDVDLFPQSGANTSDYSGTCFCGRFAVSWTMDTRNKPSLAVKYSDGTFKHLHSLQPISVETAGITVNSGSTPDEVATVFQVPVRMNLESFALAWDPDQDCFITLYDADGAVVAQMSTETNNSATGGRARPDNGANRSWFLFPTKPIVQPNVDYYLAVAPKAASPNITHYRHTAQSAAYMTAWAGGSTWRLAHRVNGGAWTIVTNQRPINSMVFGSVGTLAGEDEATFDPEDIAPIGLTWVEFTDSDDDQHRWSNVALPDPSTYYGGYKEPRVTQWGSIRRALSNAVNGQYEGSVWSWDLNDTDRAIRALLAGQLTRFFFNRSVTGRTITDTGRRALQTARTIFRGVVRGFQPKAQGLFGFEVEDYLVTTFQIGTELAQVPRRKTGLTDFPNADQETVVEGDSEDPEGHIPTVERLGAVDLPIPIIYGEISDQVFELQPQPTTGVNVLPYNASLAYFHNHTDAAASGVADGLGSFAENERVNFVVTGIFGGVEGPVAYFFGINMGTPASSVRVHFNNIGADSYRVYLYNGAGFDPHGNPYDTTVCVFQSHDNTTFDGGYGYHFSVIFHSFADGTAYPGSSTTDVLVDVGRGLVPVTYVGLRDISGTNWHEFVVCGHALKNIIGIYQNGLPIATAEADTGNSLLVPYIGTGWTGVFGSTKYRDFNGRRYTVLYAKVGSVIGEAAADASQPLLLNVQGIEATGDGTGTLITSMLDQYLHALKNWLIGDYQSGAWLTAPVFPDDVTLTQIDEDSFSVAKTVSEERLAGGYVGAVNFGLDGRFVSVRDAIAQLNLNMDVNSGFNQKTQFFVSMQSENPAQLENNPTITQTRDILKDTFSVRAVVEEFYNRIPYTYFYRPSESSWDHITFVSDNESITETNETRSAPSRQLQFVYDAEVAENVASRFLLRSKEVPRLVTWQMGMAGLNFEMGAIVLVTHTDGVGVNGYAGAPIRVTRQDYDPDQYIVFLEGYDVEQFFFGAFILGDEATLPSTWTSATEAQQRYGYLGDETTGQFSNGDPIKRLR